MTLFTIQFQNIRNSDIVLVGGKNASLGEMLSELSPKGIKIPDGFATTAEAFRTFLEENNLTEKLAKKLKELDTVKLSNLGEAGEACRSLMASGVFSGQMKAEFQEAYRNLSKGDKISVAVRS